MAGSTGPNIVDNGLVLYVDDSNTQSYTTGASTWFDLTANSNNGAISTASTFGSSMSWSNNIETITINIILKKTGANNEYAYHPINKWNNGYNNNASFILYHFGNFGGVLPNDDGRLTFYGNVTAENGTGWTSISSSYLLSINQTVNIGFTYNYLSGGQLWINGAKIGGLTSGGRLGQTSINSTVSNLQIQGPNIYDAHKIYYCSIYNRALTDNEMVQNYNATKFRFGLS